MYTEFILVRFRVIFVPSKLQLSLDQHYSFEFSKVECKKSKSGRSEYLLRHNTGWPRSAIDRSTHFEN